MIEITHEILEQAVEREKADQKKLAKRTNRFLVSLFVICVLELIPMLLILRADQLRGLAWSALIIILDIVYLFIGTTIISGSHFGNTSIFRVLRSFSDTKFYKELNCSDTKRKIILLEERLKKSKGEVWIISAGSLMGYYVEMNMPEKADELYRQAKSFKPSNDAQAACKINLELGYFDFKDDNDSYLRSFEDNSELLIRNEWNNPRVIYKIGFLAAYSSYYTIKKDYAKAIEIYDFYRELLNMAAETDKSIEKMRDSSNKTCSISYAKLFCHLGDKEKAAAYFKDAMAKYDDSAEPSIKKFYTETKQLLDEAGVDYSEQNT
ncbi:MAG: hypothetical protein ACI4YB_12950 [Oscillospiraceae bacterium]